MGTKHITQQGEAEQNSGCLPVRYMWRNCTQSAKVTGAICKKYPATAIVPLVIFAVLFGVSLFARIRTERAYENDLRSKVQAVSMSAAQHLQQDLQGSLNPIMSVAWIVQQQPNWAQLSVMLPAFAKGYETTANLPRSLMAIMLAPFSVVRLVLPPISTLSAMLGENLLSNSSVLCSDAQTAMQTGQAKVFGPMQLQMPGVQIVVGLQPVFIPNVTVNELFGQSNDITGCPSCYNSTTRTKFWGFVMAIISLDTLIDGDGYDGEAPLLSASGYRYRLTQHNTSDPSQETTIKESSNPPVDPESIQIQIPNHFHFAGWTLYVSPEDGWEHRLINVATALVVVVPVLISALIFFLIASKRKHQLLLTTMVPKQLIALLQGGDEVLLSDPPVVDPDSPADRILRVTAQILEGELPSIQDVLVIRTAILRSINVYQPLNIAEKLAARVDRDVARSLMQQLGERDALRYDASQRSACGGPLPTIYSTVPGMPHSGPMHGDGNRNHEFESLPGALTAIIMDQCYARAGHDWLSGLAQSVPHISDNMHEVAAVAGVQHLSSMPSLASMLGRPSIMGLIDAAGPAPCISAVRRARSSYMCSAQVPLNQELVDTLSGGPKSDSNEFLLQTSTRNTKRALDLHGPSQPMVINPSKQLLLSNRRSIAGIGSSTNSLEISSPASNCPIIAHLTCSGADKQSPCSNGAVTLQSAPASASLSGGSSAKLLAAAAGSALVRKSCTTAGTPDAAPAPNSNGEGAKGFLKPVSALVSALIPSASSSRTVHPDDSAKVQLDQQQQQQQQSGEATPPAPPSVIMEEVEQVLAAAFSDWEFNAHHLDQVTLGHPLSTLGFFLVVKTGLAEHFKLPHVTLARYLRAVESGYNPNPYHNKVHASSVLQSIHVIATQGGLVPGYMDPLTQLAVYMAAAVHDYEHVGLTNDFLISTADELAQMYNDRSPMENHHLAASFALMRCAGHDILATMSKTQRDSLRKMIIDLVLGTDMKQHFGIASHFSAVHRLTVSDAATDAAALILSQTSPTKAKATSQMDEAVRGRGGVSSADIQPNIAIPVDEAERLLSLQVALKCADLGHLTAPLDMHLRWVAALEEEFFLQGDREKELGLPVSPLFDRDKPGVTKSQVGFFDFVALPLFYTFARVFPSTLPLLHNLLANYRYWKEMASPGAASSLQGQAPLINNPLAAKPSNDTTASVTSTAAGILNRLTVLTSRMSKDTVSSSAHLSTRASRPLQSSRASSTGDRDSGHLSGMKSNRSSGQSMSLGRLIGWPLQRSQGSRRASQETRRASIDVPSASWTLPMVQSSGRASASQLPMA